MIQSPIAAQVPVPWLGSNCVSTECIEVNVLVAVATELIMHHLSIFVKFKGIH